MSQSGSKSRRSAGRPRDLARRHRSTDGISASMSVGTRLSPSLKVLTDSEVLRIHRAALDLLANAGVANPTPRVLEVAQSSGCTVNAEGRLPFPPALVEDMIASAATDFMVHGRDQQFDWQATNGSVNFCTGGAAVTMLDIDNHQYRPSTLTDLYDLARLCDTLDNIQWFARPVVATDLTDLFELDVNTVYACAAGTRKHIAPA